MSQEKVARYKEEKANRKEMMKKQKRAAILRSCMAGVVLVATLGWVGWSGVKYYNENKPRPSVNVNYTAIGDYIDALTTEDTTGDLIGSVEEGAEVNTEITE